MPKSLLEIARAKAAPDEHTEQAFVLQWCQLNSGRYPELKELFAIPNGGFRFVRTAGRLKAEGVKRGVEDLMLLVPKGDYHGLLIEMKKAHGVPSDVTAEQRGWHERHRARGFRVEVCFGAEQAQRVLLCWVKLKAK